MKNLIIKNFSVNIANQKVVSKVSFVVKPGEVHVIMGQNGSGKSSLLNALMGHPKYQVKEGSLKLGRSYITNLKPHEKAKRGLFLSMQHIPEIYGITFAYFLYQASRGLNGETKKIIDFYAEAKGLARKFGIEESFLDRPLNAELSGDRKSVV